jgi:hypothetical protein
MHRMQGWESQGLTAAMTGVTASRRAADPAGPPCCAGSTASSSKSLTRLSSDTRSTRLMSCSLPKALARALTATVACELRNFACMDRKDSHAGCSEHVKHSSGAQAFLDVAIPMSGPWLPSCFLLNVVEQPQNLTSALSSGAELPSKPAASTGRRPFQIWTRWGRMAAAP